MAAKLKMALYWGASCGGCDVAALDIHEKILDLAEAVDIVFWPVAMDYKYKDLEDKVPGEIDVCLFNGAVRNSENCELARLLREKSKIMVAVGSCAVSGGVPAMAGFYSKKELLNRVYVETPTSKNPQEVFPVPEHNGQKGELHLPEFWEEMYSLDQVVDVDYYLPGCPPSPDRVWEALKAVISGELPPAKSVVGALDKPLCEECTREKKEKRVERFYRPHEIVPDTERCLLEQGLVCMGPVTRAGCGAQCIKANMPCRGCYSPVPGAIEQGARFASSLASILEAQEPDEIEEKLGEIPDPAGMFYRFGMSKALLKGASKK